mgnify:FL=1
MLQIPSNCTGCHACVNICPANCIIMKESESGFLNPMLNQSLCINCGKCEKICPVLHMPEINKETAAYAMKNCDESVRKSSTSGGIFFLLSEYVLGRGGIIWGAAYASGFSVRHIAVSDREGLSSLQGAKYVQSVIGTSFQEVKRELQKGRIVLFSGTPCQCAGLKSFLGKEYENLITVDMVCHGVPSPKVWQAYIDYRSQKENAGKRPVKINMRSKASGWSHYGYSTEFDYGNSKISRIQNSRDLFMKAFVGNICLRSSCSNCIAKGVDRCTDFTLGDYWGIWNQHPEFDDNKGTSVVFVHSQKGREILNQVRENIVCLEVDIKAAYRENGSVVNSSVMHIGRADFLKRVTADNFEEIVSQYFPEHIEKRMGLLYSIKRKAKNILNKICR